MMSIHLTEHDLVNYILFSRKNEFRGSISLLYNLLFNVIFAENDYLSY